MALKSSFKLACQPIPNLGGGFTGSMYDDTAIQAEVDLNTAKVSDVDHPLVETAVPVGALFTDTDTTYTVFTSFDEGLAPASGGGTTTYLRADGTWATPDSAPLAGIGSLTDVDVTTNAPIVGEILLWDGTNWIPQSAPAADITASTIGQLSDVTLTTPSLNDVLTWNGAEWVASSGVSLSQLTTVPVPNSTLSDLGFMELQSAGNYNLPLANTVAANTIINVTVTSTYSANAPKILVQGGDTITDSTGVDVDGELLFAGAISIKLISDGISSWRY